MKWLTVLSVEFFKQKRGIIWWLVIGGPLLVAFCIFMDMYVRYDYLVAKGKGMTSWEVMLQELFFLWAFFLPIGITLIASIIHFREYSENVWKHMLALPLTRYSVYTAKWFTILFFTYVAILILEVALFLIGKLLQYPEPFDLLLYGKYTLLQCVSVLGVVSLQNWLSSRMKNTLIAATIGIVGSICAIFFAQAEITRYIPYAAVFFTVPFENGENHVAIWGGLVTGAVGFLMGMIDFNKKDIL